MTAAASHSRQRPLAGSASSVSRTAGSTNSGASLSPKKDGPTMVEVPDVAAGLASPGGGLMSRKRGRSMRASSAASGCNPKRLSTSSAAALVVSTTGFGDSLLVLAAGTSALVDDAAPSLATIKGLAPSAAGLD